MRAPVCVAAHLLQRFYAEALCGIRQSYAQTGVILMIACALDLDILAVQIEPGVCIKAQGTDTEAGLVVIGRRAVSLYFSHQKIHVALFQRPKLRTANAHLLLKRSRAVVRYRQGLA